MSEVPRSPCSGAAEIAGELHRPGRVEAKLVAKRLALGFRHRLADDLAQRIAKRRAHGKGDEQDRQHDEQGLRETARDEGERLRQSLSWMDHSVPPP